MLSSYVTLRMVIGAAYTSRKDRDTSTIGGGVFQISKEDLITSQLDNLCSANSESISTETQIKGISPIVIIMYFLSST